jgi:hypothetical protein
MTIHNVRVPFAGSIAVDCDCREWSGIRPCYLVIETKSILPIFYLYRLFHMTHLTFHQPDNPTVGNTASCVRKVVRCDRETNTIENLIEVCHSDSLKNGVTNIIGSVSIPRFFSIRVPFFDSE